MLLIAVAFSGSAMAQPRFVPDDERIRAAAAVPQADEGRDAAQLIELNFPPNVELSVLLDYVSGRLGINILYDQQAANRRLTLLAPQPIPRSSLLGVLQSALEMQGLALIDTSTDNLMRVAPTANMPEFSALHDAAAEGQQPPVVTQIFELAHISPRQADQIVRPFLSKQGANALAVEQQGLLVVTDFAGNLPRLERLVALADQPARQVVTRFVPVRHADGSQLARMVKQMVALQARSEGDQNANDAVELLHDPRTNQLAVIGAAPRVDAALEAIASLDVPVAEERSPIRFYKLANTTVADVIETIRAIEGEQGLAAVLFDESAAGSESTAAVSPDGMAAAPTESPQTGSPASVELPEGATDAGVSSRVGPRRQMPLPADSGKQTSIFEDSRETLVLTTPKARITGDVNTNTVIVIADPVVQNIYAQLIGRLDQRRPQVLLEATLVNLDTSDGFNLGVEVSGSFGDPDRVLNFSSFGLSDVDADTGRLTIKPALGYNGALISADIADVVVQALATSGRARVASVPRVLVNDNATATLTSLSQEPFESTSTTDTVAQQGFGGFVEAGTKITVTPHISEDDYLQLEYEVELSSFTGERVGNLTPPRQENTLKSAVTVPDGYAVITGGLTREDQSQSHNRVPVLGDIPILGTAFGTQRATFSKSTLFVFLRPVILRDDEFADLRYLSGQDLARAQLPDAFPASEAMLIR